MLLMSTLIGSLCVGLRFSWAAEFLAESQNLPFSQNFDTLLPNFAEVKKTTGD